MTRKPRASSATPKTDRPRAQRDLAEGVTSDEMAVAASNTLLQYSIVPASVNFGATVTFTLTALNNGSQDIKFRPADSISLLLPVGAGAADLLINSNVGATSLTTGFIFTQVQAQPGGFLVAVNAEQTIEPGVSLSFQISGAQINATSTKGVQPTSVSLPVTESIGMSTNHTFLAVMKTPPPLAVSCSASPQIVGLNQPTNISWTATSAAYVILTPGNLRQECSGIYSKNVFNSVVPPQVPVTPFQVTAYTDDQQSVGSIPVNVQTVPPVIDFGPRNLPPIGYQDSVTLTWATQYANAVYLTPTRQPPQVAPSGSLPIKPSTVAALPNASSVTFTLTAYGYQDAVHKTVTVQFQPVRILYFGYSAPPPAQSSPLAVVQNGIQTIFQTASNPDIFQLTASGAGGPLVRYLGPGPWLEIIYFGGAPNPVAPGKPCTLSWVTQNAKSATLNGAPVTLNPSDNNQQTGTSTVSPTIATVYTLAVVDAEGDTIANQITISVSS